MKMCNAQGECEYKRELDVSEQIEEVDELLNYIYGLGHDYDGVSSEKDLKGVIDDMVKWALEAMQKLASIKNIHGAEK